MIYVIILKSSTMSVTSAKVESSDIVLSNNRGDWPWEALPVTFANGGENHM